VIAASLADLGLYHRPSFSTLIQVNLASRSRPSAKPRALGDKAQLVHRGVCGQMDRTAGSAPHGVSAVNTVMSSPVVPRVVSVIVVAVISRRWWRCDKTCHRRHSSADCGAEGRTVTAGSGSPDCSPAACAD
jgi:hypothetical protein